MHRGPSPMSVGRGVSASAVSPETGGSWDFPGRRATSWLGDQMLPQSQLMVTYEPPDGTWTFVTHDACLIKYMLDNHLAAGMIHVIICGVLTPAGAVTQGGSAWGAGGARSRAGVAGSCPPGSQPCVGTGRRVLQTHGGRRVSDEPTAPHPAHGPDSMLPQTSGWLPPWGGGVPLPCPWRVVASGACTGWSPTTVLQSQMSTLLRPTALPQHQSGWVSDPGVICVCVHPRYQSCIYICPRSPVIVYQSPFICHYLSFSIHLCH